MQQPPLVTAPPLPQQVPSLTAPSTAMHTAFEAQNQAIEEVSASGMH
jgi:hypothetical protein